MPLADMAHLTHALLRPDVAVAAAEAMCGPLGQAEVEGLVELIARPHASRAGVAAISALDGSDHPIVLEALRDALGSPHAPVRIVAIQSLDQRGAASAVEGPLAWVLGRDGSWLVRRAALRALAGVPGPGRWRVTEAATDPHWRVRHALIRVFLRWGESDDGRAEVAHRLARAGPHPRVRGLREYLRYRWTGDPPPPDLRLEPDDPGRSVPFWDWDAAVLGRHLERMGEAGRRAAIDAMPALLGHREDRVRALAAATLRIRGEPRHLAEALTLLDEPRTGAVESVVKLVGSLDLDRAEVLARFVLALSNPSPAQLAWAVDRVGEALPPETESATLIDLLDRAADRPPEVRRALARLAARWEHPQAGRWRNTFLDDPDPDARLDALRGTSRSAPDAPDEATLGRLLDSEHAPLRAEAVKVAIEQGCDLGRIAVAVEDRDAGVRMALAAGLARRGDAGGAAVLELLRSDPHPHVRAAALTPTSAALLVADPTRETSWHVLAQAARLMRMPPWKLEPERPWTPAGHPPPVPGRLELRPAAPPHARTLGPGGPAVAPIGISGHYGLPVEGFVRAVEAGVNLLFWEPNYHTLTEFATRHSGADRAALHFLTGTFEADGDRVRKDVERALRMLKLDRIALVLLFWVQSWDRVAPDVREALDRLKATGKVANYGLSTHSRPLAIEALEAGWDPVMVRHSAAHRGAEERIFPRAAELETSLITFNSTCYGRLLEPRGEGSPPGAADCYRYTLAQPGVRVCLAAPATLAHLEENLAALLDPALPPDRRDRLRAHGDRVYEEDAMFRQLVRSL